MTPSKTCPKCGEKKDKQYFFACLSMDTGEGCVLQSTQCKLNVARRQRDLLLEIANEIMTAAQRIRDTTNNQNSQDYHNGGAACLAQMLDEYEQRKDKP